MHMLHQTLPERPASVPCLLCPLCPRSVCSRCGTELGSDPALLRDLIAAACAQVAPLPAEGAAAGHVALGQEEREWVVEGLARAVAVLPADAAAEAGQMLVRPLVRRAQSIISHGEVLLSAVCPDLHGALCHWGPLTVPPAGRLDVLQAMQRP